MPGVCARRSRQAHMTSYDLMYMWHSICDVARDIWNMSPTMMVVIGMALSVVVYFSFKR
jgi:hypothetical protein